MQGTQDFQDINHFATHGARPSMNGVGDMGGFAQQSFHSHNKPSMGSLRDRHGAQMPAINTNRIGQQNVQHTPQDMGTPGTGFDMNFAQLLPSQLLSSPYPNSSSTFQSPQFQNLSNFQQHPHHGQHQQANYMSSPLGQHSMSPQVFQNMVSPGAMNSPGNFGMQYGSMNGPNNMNSPVNGQISMGGNGAYVSGNSRTVYLGNIPADTSAEEILNHVRSGQIESVRLLPDKNCAFISFVDSNSAVHFHSDAILKKLSIKGQDIKIGWGKPSQVPSSVSIAIQQSGASRNVYLGNLPAEITEEELREDLGKFGPIDTIKLVREKAIGFIHFLSIGNAIKAVTQLPQDAKWQPPRRVFYGKDRCAYVSKTQQQNAAQYLGIAPGYAHVLNATDRDIISNALAQQSVAAAAVATAAGGASNLGNRTVYMGNIHPETTTEEICNVVRGGLLHHVRYIPDKHICFVTFIDPTAAASFFAHSNVSGLMIHNRRLKIGWGKHSGALPPAIALAVSGGASRNVYIGNIDESWTEERLRQDFSEYGEIELINALREKSCAFVNFTNIQNAIKAIEAIRGRDEYKRFKINFGKDRCGNQPRQSNNHHNNGGNHQPQQQQQQQQQQSNQQAQQPQQMGLDSISSPTINGTFQHGRGSIGGASSSPANSGAFANQLNGVMSHANGHHNPSSSTQTIRDPMHAYLNQVNYQHNQEAIGSTSHQQQYQANGLSNGIAHQPSASYGGHGQSNMSRSSLEPPTQPGPYASHGPSNSFSVNSTGAPTVEGMLAAPALNPKHNRATSLPAQSAFSQGPFTGAAQGATSTGLGSLGGGMGSGLGGINSSFGGLNINGDGLLHGWAEEEVGS